MKNVIQMIMAAIMIITLSKGTCFAWGFDVRIETTNDTFKSTGTLKGTQVNTAGGSSQIVALRGRVPSVDGKLRYKSSNNKYINDGDLIASQYNYAGGASQFVGLEAY